MYQAGIWEDQLTPTMLPGSAVPLIPALLAFSRTDNIDTLLIVPYESESLQRLTFLKHLRILRSLKDTLESNHCSMHCDDAGSERDSKDMV